MTLPYIDRRPAYYFPEVNLKKKKRFILIPFSQYQTQYPTAFPAEIIAPESHP